LLDSFSQQRYSASVRDWFFIFYQVNAIFAMGFVGGPVVLWLAYRALRRRRQQSAARPKVQRPKRRAREIPQTLAGATPEQAFWRILVAAGVVLGVAVVGESDLFGVGHLTLLSLQVVGMSMLAAVIPWRRGTLAIVILAGCAADFSSGVLLQAHVEGLENTAQSTVFPGMEFTGGAVQASPPGPDALSPSAWNNWFVKHRLLDYDVWLRDLKQRYGSDPAFQATLPQYKEIADKVVAGDIKNWQGWFVHHGGQVEFLGDHVGAWSAAFQSAN
jgi:hypothetical protein